MPSSTKATTKSPKSPKSSAKTSKTKAKSTAITKPKTTTISKKQMQHLTDIDQQLIKDLKSLTKEVKKLKKLEFFKLVNHPGKLIWYSFLKGLMVGFGSLLGATVLVWILIQILSEISWIPVIGDFVEKILEQIK